MTLPTGVYRIVQWGQPQLLTVENGHVTALPPGRALLRGQEWFIKTLENGTVAI
ncbi:uncharacterized protein LACBIDRAFT_316609 [Laccaria bicolor S238N-H82]|uniref:Predicted protein n=1 Tax=Laccaria bicolor (strain S238N-H82 / ATCC MYA-4686) TaxID=486041 RepID=B0E195_LACBS|nr:uncharacterized protein LACBIDRAFT_316609 [Laccaria bicolor S238N-H82]EDQ99384.1 predicted protein [Laccaria bicolor S238N-H82]|eukprot:XP_001889935.1 predicted protein [Laccaria bicolor S238N-H82]